MPSYALKLMEPPATEPVDMATLAAHARADAGEETALLAIYLKAAIAWVQDVANRQLVNATYRLTLDRFPWPGCNYYGGEGDPLVGFGIFDPATAAIKLPRAPASAVTSIQYVDAGGDTQTLDPDLYLVDTDSEPGRILPAAGTSWPQTQLRTGAVIVTYVAGYGPGPTAVPATYQLAIMQLAAHWYANRETVQPGSFGEVPLSVQALVKTDRVKEF